MCAQIFAESLGSTMLFVQYLCNIGHQGQEIFEDDGGVTYLLEHNIVMHKRTLLLDSLRVDEKSPIVLLFEQAEVIAVRV